MRVYCGVTTAPRPGGSLLRPTIAYLRCSGFEDIEVFAEPNSDLAGVYEPVRHTEEKFGAYRNFLWAVRMGLDSDADFIAVAQDDIATAVGLKDFLIETVTAGWHSPYTPGFAGEWATDGWCAIPDTHNHRDYGACFLIANRDTAQRFIRTQPANTAPNGTDRWITKWSKKTNTPLYYHTPSLVQHLGRESTIHPGMVHNSMRRATRYCDDVSTIERSSVELATPPQPTEDREASWGVGAD